jgi:hypothetical protein
MAEEVKKDIWKQQQLIEFLLEGQELGVDDAGHAEIQEAYLKLSDLFNRDGDLMNARDAMKKANEHASLMEEAVDAPSAAGKIPEVMISSSDGAVGRSEEEKNSSQVVLQAPQEVVDAEEAATKLAKEEMVKLAIAMGERRQMPRDQAHDTVINECTRIQDKVSQVLDSHLEEASDLAQTHLPVKGDGISDTGSNGSPGGQGGIGNNNSVDSKRAATFRFWYEDVLHQTERMLQSCKVQCKEILARAVDTEKEEWMQAAQEVIDQKQEENELVALVLVDELVGAYREADEDRAAWQLQSNQEVARVCDLILHNWRERASRQKDEENEVLRQRHHADALMRQKQAFQIAGFGYGKEGENGGTLSHVLNTGLEFKRLQSAFSQAIPTTAATNSLEVEKLQEQISKWRDNARVQIEKDSENQIKAWKDRVGKQETPQRKLAALEKIQNERREATAALVASAQDAGVLFAEELDDEESIDGPGAGLDQASVISMLTVDTVARDNNVAVAADKQGESSPAVKSGKRPLSRGETMKEGDSPSGKAGSPKKKPSPVRRSASIGTSIKGGIRDEASKNYKKMESKYGGEKKTGGTGGVGITDADQELIKLQLLRQKQVDDMVAEQKAHWQAVIKEERRVQMAEEKRQRMEKEEAERQAKREAERAAKEEAERKAIEIEKEWQRLQAKADKEKEAKQKRLKEKAEKAEVALGVQHVAGAHVKKFVKKKGEDAKAAAARERVEERQRKEYERLFPKRHAEISENAVKKEQAEQRRLRKEREKYHMIGMNFSTKDKEDAYLELMRRTIEPLNRSILSPERRHEVGKPEEMLEKANKRHSNEGPTEFNAYGLVKVAPESGGLEGGRNVGGPSFMGVPSGIGPEHSVASHLQTKKKPGGARLDNILLLSPTKEDRGRYEDISHLDTKVVTHHPLSKRGRPVSITNTPNKHPEVMKVLENREGGALKERAEAMKVEAIENMDRIYTEEQPKLVLGQRHDGGSRPGTRGSSRGSSRGSPRRTLSRGGGSRPGTSGSAISIDGENENSMMGVILIDPGSNSPTGSRPGTTGTGTGGSRPGSVDGRPDVEYNYTAPGSTRLHTRPGKYMLESKLPPPEGATSPNADLYGNGEMSPQSFRNIAVHHDLHDNYETTYESLEYDAQDKSLASASESGVISNAHNTQSDRFGDDDGSNGLHRDAEGWQDQVEGQLVRYGSSLEQNSVSSMSLMQGAMETGADGDIGSIAPLPSYTNRDITKNLKVNPSTYKIRQREPHKNYVFACGVAGCNKSFSQSWHLRNHQYQMHGKEIRSGDFSLKKALRIHPTQLIDRNKSKKQQQQQQQQQMLQIGQGGSEDNDMMLMLTDGSSMGDGSSYEYIGGSTEGSTTEGTLTVIERRQRMNDQYASKNVSASSKSVPSGLPPIHALVPGGGGSVSSSLSAGTYNSAVRGSNNNSQFDERSLNSTLGFPLPGEGGENQSVSSGKKSQKFDSAVVTMSRKWEEAQTLAALRLHTEKLKQWRRSIEVQLLREARPLPQGKWNRRTKETHIPAAGKQETT